MSTAVETLKAYGMKPLPGMPSVDSLLAEWMHSKDISKLAVTNLADSGAFGPIIQNYLMGNTERDKEEVYHVLNYLGRNTRFSGFRQEEYNGSREQNAAIDSALSRATNIGKDFRYLAGAATRFHYSPRELNTKIPSRVRSVPIAIIGYGAAGILARFTLQGHGFTSVTNYEKSKDLGIWSRENVYKRSRNNPSLLNFQSTPLNPAPGSGEEVRSFLSIGPNNYSSIKANIESIAPGVLSHKVSVGKDIKEFPIVINCMGLGTPRHPNDPKRMKTTVSATECGERWQREIKQDEAQGKMFCFIGLGNSTAEMIRQLHVLQDKGVDCDYRILTHYPLSCIENPNTDVNGKRIFRDISQPNLTSFQGDLPDSRYDYYRALYGNKIIAGVTNWRREGPYIHYRRNGRHGFQTDHVYFDHLFTLIGYQPTEETFNLFGIPTEGGCANVDYDGEVQTKGDPENRLHKGYFVFGAAAANPLNKNAIVLPGMLYRLHDLIPSVILRAAEYVSLTEGK